VQKLARERERCRQWCAESAENVRKTQREEVRTNEKSERKSLRESSEQYKSRKRTTQCSAEYAGVERERGSGIGTRKDREIHIERNPEKRE